MTALGSSAFAIRATVILGLLQRSLSFDDLDFIFEVKWEGFRRPQFRDVLQDLTKRFPVDTQVQAFCLPTIHLYLALQRKSAIRLISCNRFALLSSVQFRSC